MRGPGPGLVDVTTLRYIVEGPVAILPAKVAVLIEVVDVDPCHWPIPPPPEVVPSLVGVEVAVPRLMPAGW